MAQEQRVAILSPIDQLMVRTYNRIFLVFEVQDHEKAIDHLSRGLSELTSSLPYLKGSVSALPDQGNRLSITWSNASPAPELKEIPAPADIPTYKQLKAAHAPIHHFTSSVVPLPVHVQITDAPVFASSCTRLDGGLILCFGVHHAVMDGAGCADLAAVWARGLTSEGSCETDPAEPLHRLERLRKASGVVVGISYEELVARHPEYRLLSVSPFANPPTPMPQSTSRIFRFPTDKLLKMRSVLQQTVPVERLTMNNMLSSLLWANITRIRQARLAKANSGNQVWQNSRLGFAVDGRNRLGDDFARGRYLGNVNLYGVAELSLSTLEAASKCGFHQGGQYQQEALQALGKVIEESASAVARVTKTHIAEVLSLVEQAPDVTDISQAWDSFHGPDFCMTSWANQGFYECDFGAGIGKPQFVRTPYVEFDGLAIVLPRKREENEQIEVVLFLNVDDIETLLQDNIVTSWF